MGNADALRPPGMATLKFAVTLGLLLILLRRENRLIAEIHPCSE
jgi:hypothetical protein